MCLESVFSSYIWSYLCELLYKLFIGLLSRKIKLLVERVNIIWDTELSVLLELMNA